MQFRPFRCKSRTNFLIIFPEEVGKRLNIKQNNKSQKGDIGEDIKNGKFIVSMFVFFTSLLWVEIDIQIKSVSCYKTSLFIASISRSVDINYFSIIIATYYLKETLKSALN